LLDGLEGEAGGGGLDQLSKLGRLGAQLVFQRAIEEEVAAFLGRARFERASEARGSRNGHRPRQVQAAEGPLTIAVPQVRDSLTRFVSSVIPDCRTAIRTRPLGETRGQFRRNQVANSREIRWRKPVKSASSRATGSVTCSLNGIPGPEVLDVPTIIQPWVSRRAGDVKRDPSSSIGRFAFQLGRGQR